MFDILINHQAGKGLGICGGGGGGRREGLMNVGGNDVSEINCTNQQIAKWLSFNFLVRVMVLHFMASTFSKVIFTFFSVDFSGTEGGLISEIALGAGPSLILFFFFEDLSIVADIMLCSIVIWG